MLEGSVKLLPVRSILHLAISDPLTFPDNIVDKCSMCGCAIQHRPVYPKRPPKVCLPCILPKLQEEAELGELNMQVQPSTLQDLKDRIKKDLN